MRIKLFETFESPSFQEISDEEYYKKIESRKRESWTELEIEKITKLFQEELGWKNCKVSSFRAASPAAFLSIEISNDPPISKWRWELLNLYIVKQEDEWFLVVPDQSFYSGPEDLLPMPVECDQFSGLVECIKKFYSK